jgi:hypothetical protein
MLRQPITACPASVKNSDAVPQLRHLEPATGLPNVVTVRGDGQYIQIHKAFSSEKPLSLLIEKLFQPRVTRPAHRQTSAIIQDNHMTVFAIRFEPRHALEIHQVRAMNADKILRIKHRLHT